MCTGSWERPRKDRLIEKQIQRKKIQKEPQTLIINIIEMKPSKSHQMTLSVNVVVVEPTNIHHLLYVIFQESAQYNLKDLKERKKTNC